MPLRHNIAMSDIQPLPHLSTRPPSALSALLFDSNETDARCRLYEQAERVWLCPADSAAADIHRALHDIEQAAHDGAFIVLSLSFEAYRAFSSATHLPEIIKPQVDDELPRTPILQAVAFRSLRLLDKNAALAWLDAQANPHTQTHLSTPTAAISAAQFHANIAEIRERIAAGQTYQVNLTFPYRAQLRAFVPNDESSAAHPNNNDSVLFATFAQLVRAVNVPYAGLLLLPENSLLSFSPELFFELDGLQLRTRPMKGTAPLGATPEETARIADALANDEKNRAENLMILDLLRNDVARLPQTRAVHVPERFHVQSYGSILQMTSTVQAELRAQPSLLALFDALFPCGSITGAPKHETLRIIQGIEPYARGAYCGAIGYIQRDANEPSLLQMRMNVAIRTLETRATPIIEPYGIARWPIQCSVGAGITYDSEAEAEWQECALKAQFLARHTAPFELIETMRLIREPVTARVQQWRVPEEYLNAHRERMMRSAQILNFVWNEDAFSACLEQARQHAQALAATSPKESALRLRISLNSDGTFTAQLAPLEAWTTPVPFAVYPEPMHSANPMLAHKTSMRAAYNHALAQAKAEGLFDYVFVNERGEITEGARSCILLQLDGAWYTPPLASGLLPSVVRTLELRNPEKRIRQQKLTLSDLHRAEQILLGNAVYGWLSARESAVDARERPVGTIR